MDERGSRAEQFDQQRPYLGAMADRSSAAMRNLTVQGLRLIASMIGRTRRPPFSLPAVHAAGRLSRHREAWITPLAV
jgi:hypothetical protein